MSRRVRGPGRRPAAWLAMPLLALTLAWSAPAMAQTGTTLPACPQASDRLLEGQLPRLLARLAGREPLRIVAIGSSSTAGAGASQAGNSYPRQLEALWRRHDSSREVTVINAGIGGQEIADMLARLEADVLAHKPDLVIWQFAANGLLRRVPIATMEADALAGIARIRASGADVLLMDLQHVPRIDAMTERDAVLAMMQRVARATDSALFHRYQLMQGWGQALGADYATVMVHPDRLHLNDTSYHCLAGALFSALLASADAARPPAYPPWAARSNSSTTMTTSVIFNQPR